MREHRLIEPLNAIERVRLTTPPPDRRLTHTEEAERLTLEGGDRELAGMEPIADHVLGKRGDAVPLVQAQPEVVVLRLVEPVAAERAKRVRSHHHGRVRQLVADEEVELRTSGLSVDLVAALVDEHDAAPEQRDVGMAVEVRDLALEPVGQHDVVGIHACDERRLRERAARVEGHRQATRVLPLDADPWIPLRCLCEQLGRPVGRAVVDDDQLEVGERLRQRRVERLAEEALAVSHWHHDADAASFDELREQRPVALDPRREVEPLDRACARSRPVVLERREHRPHRLGQLSRRGWHINLPRRLRRNADPGVAHELRHAAARRVNDRHAAGERLEHDVRTGIAHLGMEQHVRAAVERRGVALGIAANEVDAVGEPELAR